ncbi:MAG: hypothetical protein QM784_09315 [Polyangiaceae bacterium]
MIDKEGMMSLMVDACPSFQNVWEQFLQEWRDEPELPVYIALGQLASHLVTMLATGDTSRFAEIFAVVERWHLEGNAYVREAATVGVLEGLQNENLHSGTNPAQFEQFLLPESRKWWTKVKRFWDHGEIIAE